MLGLPGDFKTTCTWKIGNVAGRLLKSSGCNGVSLISGVDIMVGGKVNFYTR